MEPQEEQKAHVLFGWHVVWHLVLFVTSVAMSWNESPVKAFATIYFLRSRVGAQVAAASSRRWSGWHAAGGRVGLVCRRMLSDPDFVPVK